MIVDLLRNDLGRIATAGSVRGAGTVHARAIRDGVAAHVDRDSRRRRRRPGCSTCFGALFPCGSVTGAPKIAAMASSPSSRPSRAACTAARSACSPPPGTSRGRCSRCRSAPPCSTRPTQHVRVRRWRRHHVVVEPRRRGCGGRAKTRILTRSRREFSLARDDPARADGAAHVELHLDRLHRDRRLVRRFPSIGRQCQRTIAAVEPPSTCASASGCWWQRLGRSASSSTRSTQPARTVRPGDAGDRHRGHPFRRPVLLPQDHVAPALRPSARTPPPCRRRGAGQRARRGRSRPPSPTSPSAMGDQWFCPPLSDGGLPGVGRGRRPARRTPHRTQHSRPPTCTRCDELAVLERVCEAGDLRRWYRAIDP